jgi:hypothetical protein
MASAVVGTWSSCELREAEQEEHRIEGLQKVNPLQLRTFSAKCHRQVTSVNIAANALISA